MEPNQALTMFQQVWKIKQEAKSVPNEDINSQTIKRPKSLTQQACFKVVLAALAVEAQVKAPMLAAISVKQHSLSH